MLGHYLVAYGDGPALDGVHAEDGRLRIIGDGGREHRAEDAAVRDREGAALELGELDPLVPRPRGEIGQRGLDLAEVHAVGVAEHRHEEAPVGRYGDADVVEIGGHELVALDAAVDDRVLLERLYRRLDEEGHEAELRLVLRLEILAVGLADADELGHVDFVEGGEVGGFLPGLHEPPRDSLPHHRQGGAGYAGGLPFGRGLPFRLPRGRPLR